MSTGGRHSRRTSWCINWIKIIPTLTKMSVQEHSIRSSPRHAATNSSSSDSCFRSTRFDSKTILEEKPHVLLTWLYGMPLRPLNVFVGLSQSVLFENRSGWFGSRRRRNWFANIFLYVNVAMRRYKEEQLRKTFYIFAGLVNVISSPQTYMTSWLAVCKSQHPSLSFSVLGPRQSQREYCAGQIISSFDSLLINSEGSNLNQLTFNQA